MSRAPIPARLRSIRGGQQGRSGDPVVDPPRHLSDLAAKIWRELAPAVFRTSPSDAGGCDLLGKFCEIMAVDWTTERRAPELGRVFGASLGLSPASRRRLERLALPKTEKPRVDAWHRS